MPEETYITCFFVFIVGACIGSFLNVVGLRALSKESIVMPASKCPICNEPIKWYDNIPILSYFLTFKGKCRNCGEKVSIQYPIVEFITAVLFLTVYIIFGETLKTLLILILLSTSIVITITDIKKEYVFEVHSWILIITAIITSLYLNGLNNYSKPAIGLIIGVFVMELLARLSYYLVRKKQTNETKNTQENNETEKQKLEEKKENEENEENFDINEYVNKNKRAFGEGDTYLAAASGALLGWKYLIIAVIFAVIAQAACILPQFLIGLYKQQQKGLLISILSFVFLAGIYWILSNIYNLNILIEFAFSVILIFLAIYSITGLKKIVNKQGFSAIPFGPSLLFTTFLIFFWGSQIMDFVKKHILFEF